MPARLVEESAREQAESLQAEEAAARHTAAEEQRTRRCAPSKSECSDAGASASQAAETAFTARGSSSAQELGATVRETQARLVDLRREQQETGQKLERMREGLSAERARHASIEQILSERAYTADAVQKLFNVNGGRRGIAAAVPRRGLAGGLRRSAGKVRRRHRTIPAR